MCVAAPVPQPLLHPAAVRGGGVNASTCSSGSAAAASHGVTSHLRRRIGGIGGMSTAVRAGALLAASTWKELLACSPYTLTADMAASSGITVGPELAHAFATACSEAKTRLFKIELQGETLACSCSLPSQSSDADDFSLLQSVLVEKQACYICYRMDSSPPCCWIFVMYVPNGTTVRDRMLYAATREATKSALGGSAVFCHEMHCGSKEELTYASYAADISSSAAPAPKTDGEMLKEKLKLLEIAETSSAGGSSASSGANVAFPLSAQAKAAIAQINSGSGQWITAFNVAGSQIDVIAQAPPSLTDRDALAASSAAFLLSASASSPAFALIRAENAVVFVYWCPDSAAVRSKMTHSTAKGAFVASLAQEGLKPVAVMEVHDVDELDSASLNSALRGEDAAAAASAAAAAAEEKKFSKPSRPGGGGRRLMK